MFFFLLIARFGVCYGKDQSHYEQMKTHLSYAYPANPTQWFNWWLTQTSTQPSHLCVQDGWSQSVSLPARDVRFRFHVIGLETPLGIFNRSCRLTQLGLPLRSPLVQPIFLSSASTRHACLLMCTSILDEQPGRYPTIWDIVCLFGFLNCKLD